MNLAAFNKVYILVFTYGCQLLMFFGVIGFLYYSFNLIIRAFQAHILWGLATLLVSFAGIVFIFKRWDLTKEALVGLLKSVGLGLFGFLFINILVPMIVFQ